MRVYAISAAELQSPLIVKLLLSRFLWHEVLSKAAFKEHDLSLLWMAVVV